MKVADLKKWLNNFIDDADVEFSINGNVSYNNVTLHITIDGLPSGATLELTDVAEPQ